MSFLTGKTTPATSNNQAYPWLQQTYGGQAQSGVGATNQLAALLGVGGDPTAANSAYNTFKNSSGYQNIFNEAMRGVTNSAAGRGLFGSGATGRALTTTAGNLANQSFGNYLAQLQGLSGLGLQAGGLIGQAGQQSIGEQHKPGLFDAIGGALQLAGTAAPFFSDRRLKTDIQKVGEFDDGLGVYDFRYMRTPFRMRGVMADEVETLRPWALGPKIAGFSTVNYGSL